MLVVTYKGCTTLLLKLGGTVVVLFTQNSSLMKTDLIDLLRTAPNIFLPFLVVLQILYFEINNTDDLIIVLFFWSFLVVS